MFTASETLVYVGLESEDRGSVRAFEGLEDGSSSSGMVGVLGCLKKIEIFV